MKKKKIIAAMMSAAMLFSVVTPYLPAQAEERNAVLQKTDAEAERETINFNTDWHYHKGDAAGADQAAFADDGWVYVNLPHSTDFYDADNKDAYLGVSWYRKDFTPDPSLEGKELLLTFEAAMQKAEVYLNGEKIMTHEGGYSPFVIDLTGLVNYGETNVIAVKIDSSPNTNFAPGKTNPDFQYWGGIYGEAYLTVKDPVHITDAVEADTTAGGGVFITAPEVGTESAVVKVKTQVENLSGEEQNVTLRTEILNEDGTEAASQESTEEIGSAEASDFTHVLTVDDPRLWSTYTPELYTVRTTVYVDGVKKDSVDTTYGIRKVEWDLTSLSVEGNTGTMTGTARAIPGIIMEDTETTLTIQYTESAQPVRIQLLQAAYDLVKDADLTEVVESIVELYNERISAAEALLARAEAGDPALTQEEVDQSAEDLIEIVQYLSFTGNKDELEKVITAAQEMEAELDKYLEKGQAEFLAALETAENVMADGDALQEEINDVMLQLVKGMADLRLRPDKSLLEELLKEANGKNKESYTEESYQNLLSAISVADAAYSNLEADQEEVDGAAELLRAAIDSLEPAGFPDPENPDPETPGTGTSDPEPESPVSDPEDSNTGKPEGNSSDAGTQSSSLDGKKTASASGNASDAGNGNAQSAAKAVRTGDNAHPAIYAAVLLALAAGAGYTVCGRRKKK